jgi:dipeptidyl aminopeptidase/acylaminoacyl peptidase
LNRIPAILLVGLVMACTNATHSGTSPPTVPPPNAADRAGPTVVPAAGPGSLLTADTASFHGFGKLALAAAGNVWLIDGFQDRLIDLGPASFRSNLFVGWSASGRYLSFRPGANTMTYDTETDQATGGGTSDVPRWSPATDRLAIGTAGGLMVEDRILAQGGKVNSVAWSPDGRLIAYQDDPVVAVIIDAKTGTRQAQLSFPDHRRFSVDSWSTDGRALLVFESFQCISCAADGQAPWLLSLGGLPAVQLPNALQHRALRSWSPAAPLLLLTQGGGRVFWDGKSQAVCDRHASCRNLPQPEGEFDFQGRWSPGGGEIAFLRAPLLEGAGFAPPRIQDWYRQHELWASALDGTGARQVDPARGAVWADWAADGRHLLEVRDRWLWLLDSATGTSVPITGPLDDVELIYYGWYDWDAAIAWWRSPVSG